LFLQEQKKDIIITQLNLNRPLRISPGPRHLSRPLAAISTYDTRPGPDTVLLLYLKCVSSACLY
jgi:hypothetical protein